MYNQGIRAFDTVTDIEAHRLLSMAANGNVAHNSATATNSPVGVSEYAANSGDTVSVKLINCAGTFEMTASGAIDRGDEVYADAAGKVSALPAGAGDYLRIGLALEAATADGDIIEVLPDNHITIVTV